MRRTRKGGKSQENDIFENKTSRRRKIGGNMRVTKMARKKFWLNAALVPKGVGGQCSACVSLHLNSSHRRRPCRGSLCSYACKCPRLQNSFAFPARRPYSEIRALVLIDSYRTCVFVCFFLNDQIQTAASG